MPRCLINFVHFKVNAVTGSLFSAEVMEKRAQESDNAVNNDDENETVCFCIGKTCMTVGLVLVLNLKRLS